MFNRIQVNNDKFQGEPTVRDTDILVTAVLEALAEQDKDAVLRQFPALEADDLREILLYTADLIRIAAEEDEEAPPMTIMDLQAIHLAVEYPATELAYVLLDAENNAELLQMTEFQLQYLKHNSTAPTTEDEGWYFGQPDLERLQHVVEQITEQIDKLYGQASALEEAPHTQEDSHLEAARITVKADLLDVKSEELEQLQAVLVTALGDYDAFEFAWKSIATNVS